MAAKFTIYNQLSNKVSMPRGTGKGDTGKDSGYSDGEIAAGGSKTLDVSTYYTFIAFVCANESGIKGYYIRNNVATQLDSYSYDYNSKTWVVLGRTDTKTYTYKPESGDKVYLTTGAMPSPDTYARVSVVTANATVSGDGAQTSDSATIVLTPNDGYTFEGVSLPTTGDIYDAGTEETDGSTVNVTSTLNDNGSVTLTVSGLSSSSGLGSDYYVEITCKAVKKVAPAKTATFFFDVRHIASATPASGTAVTNPTTIWTVVPATGYTYSAYSTTWTTQETNAVEICDETGNPSGEFAGELFQMKSDGDNLQIRLVNQSDFTSNECYLYSSEPDEKSVEPTKYTVTQTLTNCTSDFNETSVNEGTEVTINYTPDSGYTLSADDIIVSGPTATKTLTDTGVKVVFTATANAGIIAEGKESVVPVADANVIVKYLLDNDGLKAVNNNLFIVNETTIRTPSDFIYSLKRYPFTIASDGSRPMYLGSYSMGVRQNYTKKDVIEFNCGEVTVDEKFNNYTAYAPYVVYSLYLPFIGRVSIDTDRVVGHTLSLKYEVNITNGQGLAIVKSDGITVIEQNGAIGFDIAYESQSFDGIMASQLAAQLGDKSAFLECLDYGAEDISDEANLAGHKVSETIVVGDKRGFLQAEYVYTEGLSCEKKEVDSIIQLLKNGIIVK